MYKEDIMRKIIKATQGHILTNGEVFGTTIYLAEGETGEAFYEITLDEYQRIQEEMAVINDV